MVMKCPLCGRNFLLGKVFQDAPGERTGMMCSACKDSSAATFRRAKKLWAAGLVVGEENLREAREQEELVDGMLKSDEELSWE